MMQRLLALLAIASSGWAQSTTKTLTFVHTTSEQSMMEVATVTRAISEVKPSADASAKTLRIEGTAAQIAAAEWVFHELDRPAGSPPPDSPRVYKIDDPKQEGQLRVFHTSYTPNVQSLQELATAIRATTEIRRLFTYSEPRIIVVRGTDAQVAMADWLLSQLDNPTKPGFSVQRDPGLRIFYPTTIQTVQQLQEMATATRAIAGIHRLFTYNLKGAIIVRDTPDQLHLAGWLLHQLDQSAPPAQYTASTDYVMPGDAPEGTVVKVFFAPHASTVQDLQTLAVNVRTTTQVRRLFTYNTPRAITVRGTANQIARATDIIKPK
ncbi:MAG: hypothetical protein JST93_17915 [Acidobacteria bacterium]|nr:hypothetical protein [Acidobacteriota bacterium]